MRHLLMLSVLLLGASWAVAQNDSSQVNQNTPTGGGAAMTVQGCLSGSAAGYTLTDTNGNTIQLTGDTAKLSEHVGHEVKVTGNATSASPAPSGTATGSTASGDSTHQAIEVSSVKHISKSCKSNTGTMR